MKKQDLKEKLKQEIESEASALERRVNTKKSLASLEMPEDSYEDLMERIRAKKESEQESVEEPKRKVKIIPFATRRKALATVAMVAVLVVGTGLGVNGARLYVLNARNRTQDSRVDIAVDTEDVAYFELTEEEAYEKIEKEIGILALRLEDKPKGMELGDVYIDTDSNEALMEFYYKDHILAVYENKQNSNVSFNAQQDGVVVDTIEVFHLGEVIDIIEVDKKNGEISYTMQLEYGNAFYYLSSDMELFLKVFRIKMKGKRAMKNQKKILSAILGLVIMGWAWIPTKLVVHAEEIEVPGYCEYTETEGESIVHWYAIARGTYLKDGICGIIDAGKAKVTVSGTTTAHKICDTVRVSVYLDESSDGGKSFGQIGSYYFSRSGASSCHGSKADISVTSGWYYMARGGHSVTKGSTTESTTTYTGALKAS